MLLHFHAVLLKFYADSVCFYAVGTDSAGYCNCNCSVFVYFIGFCRNVQRNRIKSSLQSCTVKLKGTYFWVHMHRVELYFEVVTFHWYCLLPHSSYNYRLGKLQF